MKKHFEREKQTCLEILKICQCVIAFFYFPVIKNVKKEKAPNDAQFNPQIFLLQKMEFHILIKLLNYHE